MRLNLTERKKEEALEAPPNLLLSPSEVYHENSKLHPSDIGLYTWISFIGSSPEVRQIISRPFTHYRGYKSITLPKEFPPAPHSFEEVVVKRRSIREFSGEHMSLETLAKLLYLGDGVVETLKFGDSSEWSVRTAPSGGGLYPIELYTVVTRVENLSPGLYSYNPLKHTLEQVIERDLTEALIIASPAMEESIRGACACIMISGVMPRSKFKYGERAYRFILLEAGHVAQNILLAAQAEDLAGC